MFDDRYEVILADTDAGRKIHYQIRYQVYCLEKGYEDPSQHRDGEECDVWDARAVHFMVRDKRNNRWIGAMRLILPHPAAPLPIEQHCRIEPGAQALATPDRVAEVSRLCLLPSAVAGSLAERLMILVGLWRAVLLYSLRCNINYWYFLTRKSLIRLLNSVNVSPVCVGGETQYRGLRLPLLIGTADMVQQLRDGSPDIDQMFCHPSPLQLFSTWALSAEYSSQVSAEPRLPMLEEWVQNAA